MERDHLSERWYCQEAEMLVESNERRACAMCAAEKAIQSQCKLINITAHNELNEAVK